MNGIELLRQIKDIKPSVRTVLISAFDVDDKLFKESKCVDKFLQKPIGIVDLINEVEVLLSIRHDLLTH
jgi:response regulator RpfG family c-di-GMP phosphodiesterase